ncbi:MAG: transglutaminase domain-containing protein [Nanoarchaeota archaeon]|nr:transglutaminase domain-containing protein [Nanoarchaeota archaeon]
MIKKSVILVFIIVLFCSFSVLGLGVDISSPEYLVKESNSEELIADFLATFGNVSMPVAPEPKRAGVMALGSPASSCSTVNIQPGVENAVEHNTNKYKPLYVFRRGEMLRSKHLLKNYDPRKHGYHFAVTGPNNYKFPEGSTTWSCRTSQSLPGLMCYFNLTIPSDAPVGTYYVQRSIFDKYTGEELCSLNNDIYIIFNPYNPNVEEGGLDSSPIRAYAYDPSQGGRDQTGIWFYPYEQKVDGSWMGSDEGLKFTLHPYDQDVFKEAISKIEGYTSSWDATSKLRDFTDSYLENYTYVHHDDTNELRKPGTLAQCADHANFLVELLRSVGIPSRPVAVDANRRQAGWLFHTWTEVWLNGKWHALDAFIEEVKGIYDRGGLGRLGGPYGKQKNDLILVAKPDWNPLDVTWWGGWPITYDVIFGYVPGNEPGYPYQSVPAQNLYKKAWIEDLEFISKEYWGEPYYNPRQHNTPQDYEITVTTDKEQYSVGDSMIIIVNVSSNLDTTSTPLVHGKVLEQIPFTKVPVETTLYSFDRTISLPSYGSYQFTEYYNVSEDVITTDFFNIVVSVENVSTISFFDAKPLMSLGIKAPTAVPQDEPFTTSVTVSNNQTIALSDIEVSIERLPYNLYVEEPFVKNIPSLLQGQSEVLTWNFIGVSSGDAELVFNVSSENGGVDKIGALITIKGYPELLMNLSNPSSAGVGEEFDVTTEIFNVGGLTAKDVIVTLVLPSGILTGESLTKTIGDISGSSSASVTWSVKGGENGSYYIEAYASDVTGNYKAETLSPVEIIKKSPYELKLEALEKLKALRTGKKCSKWFWWLKKDCIYEHRINKAIYYLEQSLNRAYWLDDYTLNPKLGHKVFNFEKEAVKHLMKIKIVEVEVGEQLAFDRYEGVKDDEGDIEK